MRRFHRRHTIHAFAVLALTALVAAGCSAARIDTTVLAGDGFAGRQNGTPGSVASQNYLISVLKAYGAVGARHHQDRRRRVPPGVHRRHQHRSG